MITKEQLLDYPFWIFLFCILSMGSCTTKQIYCEWNPDKVPCIDRSK